MPALYHFLCIFALIGLVALADSNAGNADKPIAKLKVALSEWDEIAVTFFHFRDGGRPHSKLVHFHRSTSTTTISTEDARGATKTSEFRYEIGDDLARQLATAAVKHCESAASEESWLEKLQVVERKGSRAAVDAFKAANPPPLGGVPVEHMLMVSVAGKRGKATFRNDYRGGGGGATKMLKWIEEIEASIKRHASANKTVKPTSSP